uniref:Flavin-containing monooxygenase n=1 Tax=Anabas testudineus TaxID=64144 RepID=A0A3Q1K432_ANATE
MGMKACLDEGMVPTCFESSDDIGGLWKFKARLFSGKMSGNICPTFNSGSYNI